jgi:non-heme chloroperoxidase
MSWLMLRASGLQTAKDGVEMRDRVIEGFRPSARSLIDVPTLVMHGEDNQIDPVKDSARKSARLIKSAKPIYYPGAPRGLTATYQDQVNTDLLAFIMS